MSFDLGLELERDSQLHNFCLLPQGSPFDWVNSRRRAFSLPILLPSVRALSSQSSKEEVGSDSSSMIVWSCGFHPTASSAISI